MIRSLVNQYQQKSNWLGVVSIKPDNFKIWRQQTHELQIPCEKLRTRRKNASGFTIIELMLVITMAGALVVLAIPSFSQFFANNRVTTTTNDFAALLTEARSEAIKRGNDVVFCAGNISLGCIGTWGDGWIMFEDLDDDGVLDTPLASVNQSCADGDECMVEVSTDGVAFTSASDLSLVFESSGELDINFDDEPEFCVSANRSIKLNQIGRMSITNSACPGP